MLIVLLSECKRGFVALQLWLYWSAKVAVWQCKVACFEPSFVVHIMLVNVVTHCVLAR